MGLPTGIPGKPKADASSFQRNQTSRGTSPLWNRALERYHEELEDSNDDEILAGSKSFDDLIDYFKSIDRNSNRTLSGLAPKLRFVDDFSATIAICLGANTQMTALVWGSLRLIIALAVSADDTFQQVIDMLEELSLSLPRFRHYEENLQLDRSFENALVDLYSEVICFYARVIRYYKSNPHLQMQLAGWTNIQNDFTSTVRRVKRFSAIVDTQADRATMRMDRVKYDEVLTLLKELNSNKERDNLIERYCHLPVALSGRFKAREADVEVIKRALDPERGSGHLRAFGLHGMAGVGKTQLALRYILDNKDMFDVVLWIAADTGISLDQSFREVAAGLRLGQKTPNGVNELSATAQVKEWLSDPTNHRSWLVIFDNADDIALLRSVWPANGNGSVLLTSRNPNVASTVATRGLHVQPFNEVEGAEVLLQLLDVENPDSEQVLEAGSIARVLGGLPLALDQVTAFIRQRKMRMQDFMPFYERNAIKIDSRRSEFSSYPRTLATVFEMTLENLSGSALHLQNLLSFLEPDSIPEGILEEGANLIGDSDFDFLKDEMDFGDAQESLLQIALINKDANTKSLSVHRLVQTAALRRLDVLGKRKYFTALVSLLGLGFPDTWSKDVGHQKKEWARCETYLPHVDALVNVTIQHPSIVGNADTWAELLLRCSWYLYEKEQYVYAKKFVSVALDNFVNKPTLAYASAVDLLGLIELDMTTWHSAISCFEKGLLIRQQLLDANDPLIAFALNNLAIVWTEVPDLPKAERFHQQAIEIRLQKNSDRIGNSYSNYAVTQLRMGNPDKAEQMLMSCPSLKDCTDETFLQADNPRFTGDMVLLSRIRRAQGRVEDALRLASKALAWRQSVHGDRFKTCDSMYDVACLLHGQGRTATALDMLCKLSSIAGTLALGENHAARAEWKLSRILQGIGREEESAGHERAARALRQICRPNEADEDMFDERGWETLTPYMLW